MRSDRERLLDIREAIEAIEKRRKLNASEPQSQNRFSDCGFA